MSLYEKEGKNSGISANEYENAKAANNAYDRLGRAEARTNAINQKKDLEEKANLNADYGTPKTKDDINDYLWKQAKESTSKIDIVRWAENNSAKNKAAKNIELLPDKLGSFLSAESNEDLNRTQAQKQLSADMAAGGITATFDGSPYANLTYEGYSKGWDVISDREKNAYYYIYNTEGKEAAYEYLDSLTNVLQKRRNYENKQVEMKASADEGTVTNLDWLLRNAASVPDNVAGGMAGWLENQARMITGNELQPYNPAHGAVLSADATREAAAQSLDERFNASDNPLAITPSKIYQGVMSTADMATAALTGEAAYGAMMGAGAAERTARDLWEQGESNSNINGISTAAGVAEMLFETLSVEQIWNAAQLGGVKNAKELVLKYLYNFVRSGLVEASEETLTEAANMAVDYAVRGERSDVKSWEDVGNRLGSAAEGGFIGGVLGGGTAVTANALGVAGAIAKDKSDYNQYTKQTGKAIASTGNAQALIDTAMESADPKVKAQAEKAAQAQKANEQKPTKKTAKALEKEAGKLYTAVQNSSIEQANTAIENEVKTAIKQAYAEVTKDKSTSKSASIAADAIYKAKFTEQELTRKEQNTASTDAAIKAYEAVRNDTELESRIVKAQERAMQSIVSTAKLTQPQEQQKAVSDDDVDVTDYSLSDDSNTYVKGQDTPVNVGDIVGISKNDIKVKLSNGEIVSVKNLDLASTGDAVAFKSIVDMQKELGVELPASVANVVYNGLKSAQSRGYDGGVVQYIKGAEEAILKGFIGDSGEYSAKGFAANLTDAEREVYYKEGASLAEKLTQEQQAKINGLVTKEERHRAGTVTFEDNIKLSQLDERRSTGVKAQSDITKALGVDTVFYRSTKNSSGKYESVYYTREHAEGDEQAPSGFWKNGKLYIDVNAGMNGEGLILFTASHEMTHMMEDGSPELWKAYADFIVENYVKQGTDVHGLVLKEMARHTKLNYEQAFREVIARASEGMLVDTHLNEKSKKLYKQNRTLWEKIRDAFESIIARIKKAYSGAELQSEEARLIRQWDQETLEKAQEMWLEGVTSAARNLRNVEKSTEGNQKNMLRDIPSSFEQNINSVAKMGSVVSLTGNEFAKGSVDLITQVTDYFDSIGGIAHSKYGDVRLTRSGVKASIGHGIGRNKAIAFKAVQNVLQDGLMIDYQKNWKQRGYNTAVIAAPITISNTDYYMAAVVIEQAGSNDYYLHEVILKEKENVAAFKTGTVKNGAPSAVTSSIYSILHDLQNINTSMQKNQSRESVDNELSADEIREQEREKWEKREKELREHFKEQRARGYENRKRTEFRGKIKQLIDGFNTMLTHPVEGKYIPRGFVSQTIDILNAINTDSRRSERLSAAIADLKVKYEGLKADETGYASYNSAMDERLRVLSEMIEAEAEEWVPKRNKSIAYENKRSATEGKPLKRSVTSADFSIQNMSLELLQYTYETLNGMRTVIRESMCMTGEETRKMRQQITDALISEVKGVRREHTNMLTAYGNLHKSGYIMFKSFADYKKNSEWENRQNELNKGQLETSRFGIEFSKPTLDLIADKKSLDKMLHTKVDVGLKDADGNPVLVTHDMLVHIYLDLSNEHNADHVAGDGYHVPDLDLYYKGKRAKSFEGATSRLASGPYIHAVELSQRMKELDIQLNTAIKNGEDTLSIENEIDQTAAEIKKLKAESDKYLSGLKKTVESKMTAYDYQWVEAWREFNDMASSAINNVTMQTLGFKKAVVENYFPITVDKSFRAPDFDTIVSDMSLESWGSLKERVKGAKGAIVLQGITDVMADRIHKTALYCGMTIPVQNFRKVYGGTQYNFAEKKEGDDFKTSVQRELDKKFGTPTVGDSANVYIKKLVADLIESRNNSDNGADKLLALARGGIAISTLTTNPRVWLVQAASLVSALPELDMKSVLKGTATIAYKWNPHYKQKGAATRLRMSKVTPLYDLRRMGMVDTELGDIAKQRSSRVSKATAFTQKIFNLTQMVDSLTTGRIWFMCEYWVKDHKPSLREGTIEFDKAVAEKYNQVIERTQPNYTPMQRGQILRSKNAVTKLFTMWQTQRMQNVNMLFDAVGTLNRTIYDYNHGLNNVNRNDLKSAWYQAGKTTLAFLVSNAMIVAIQAAADMLIYRKFKKYSDDDDDLTTQSVLYGILLNYISTLTGNFFGGSELEDMISAVITGERYNEINSGLLGTLIEDVTSVVKTAQALQSDGVLSSDFLTNLNTAITNWCSIFGIAARNTERIYDGIVSWIEKLVDKDLFQFSEIGSHVNKALNARTINKIVNGDYSSVSVMTQDKYDEAYTKAWNKGKSEEDCQSAGRTAAKKAIANLVKETYLSTDDFETKRTIRLYMYKSGYYVVSSGKKKGQVSLDVVDRTLESWKNNQDEKDIEAQTAKERKYGK